MDTQQEIIQILESRWARWAYRLALVPIVGLLFSPLLCFIAMLSIGKNGYTGLDLIWKTGVRLLIINLVAIAGLLYLWFLPRYVEYSNLVWSTNQIVIVKTSSGFEKRACAWPVQWIKDGLWTIQTDCYPTPDEWKTPNAETTEEKRDLSQWYYEEHSFYSWGKKHGKATTYYENGNKTYEGEYNNDKESGKWQYWDEQGKLTREEIYDNDGNLISEKNITQRNRLRGNLRYRLP